MTQEVSSWLGPACHFEGACLFEMDARGSSAKIHFFLSLHTGRTLWRWSIIAFWMINSSGRGWPGFMVSSKSIGYFLGRLKSAIMVRRFWMSYFSDRPSQRSSPLPCGIRYHWSWGDWVIFEWWLGLTRLEAYIPLSMLRFPMMVSLQWGLMINDHRQTSIFMCLL